MGNVDWASYARQYDLMADNNPAYQEILSHCLDTFAACNYEPGAIIADFGAGTGNFSIALAKKLPQVVVLHVESSPEMIRIAQGKALRSELKNWSVWQRDLGSTDWGLPELSGAVTVHTLYALNEPEMAIRKIIQSVEHGGLIYACDLGRVLDMRDWTKYLLCCAVKKHGIARTVRLFMQSGIIRNQNMEIAENQRKKKYWTHTLAEFMAVFEREGVNISYAADRFYRGYDDLIIGNKGE